MLHFDFNKIFHLIKSEGNKVYRKNTASEIGSAKSGSVRMHETYI